MCVTALIIRINSQVGPMVNLNMISSRPGGPASGSVQNNDTLNRRAIKARFVNNFTAAESPLFWPGTILDNAKIVLKNNMMTLCIIMLSLPTTIMNIYVYVTGKGKLFFYLYHTILGLS